MADSWLIDGNCTNCRRKNYCSKPCTLNKRRNELILHGVVGKKIEEMFGLDKIYDAIGGR